MPGTKYEGIQTAVKNEKPVKNENFEMAVKKVQVTARKSQRREVYYCMPQRLRDAAQRRNWAFCVAIKDKELQRD
ncbi:MAG: hypothetical protein LJE63_06480 [Desulfobacteraceae bacterium]|nr:hypothetical protein [Desulfobacteraceae bacterium]